MERYRQERRARRTGPRPQGGVARRWNAFLNAVVFCIWSYPVDKDDDDDVPYVPTQESTSEPVPKEIESSKDQIFFRRTNHEPRHGSNKGPDSPGALTKTKKKRDTKSKKKSSFKWPWSKKEDNKKKMEIELVPDTLVHLDGFAGLRGQAVKDCVQQSQSVCAKLSASLTSQNSSTSKLEPKEQSLVRTSQDRLSTASSHWTVSSLPSQCVWSSLSSLDSLDTLFGISSLWSNIDHKKDFQQDNVETNVSQSSFKWGPLPLSGVSSFDINSTSDSEDDISRDDKLEPAYNVIPEALYALIKRTLNLGVPQLAIEAPPSIKAGISNPGSTEPKSTDPVPKPIPSLDKLHKDQDVQSSFDNDKSGHECISLSSSHSRVNTSNDKRASILDLLSMCSYDSIDDGDISEALQPASETETHIKTMAEESAIKEKRPKESILELLSICSYNSNDDDKTTSMEAPELAAEPEVQVDEVLLELNVKKSEKLSLEDDNHITANNKNTSDEVQELKMEETAAVDSGVISANPSEITAGL